MRRRNRRRHWGRLGRRESRWLERRVLRKAALVEVVRACGLVPGGRSEYDTLGITPTYFDACVRAPYALRSTFVSINRA